MNYKMKIAVCDDDEKDRNCLVGLIREYLDQHHYHIRIDEFDNGESFLQGDVSAYDLVVLDIYMGDKNGIDVAKSLVIRNPGTQIIFCSTSNAFAAESYDVSALRYLIKPVEREKLFGTLERFFHVHTTMRTLTYKQNRMDEHIYVQDILWVEADGHRCVLHTRNGNIETRTPFSYFCEELQDSDFVKPIRYALVSLQAVAAIPTDVFTLVTGDQVPISRALRGDMKKAFSDYKMRSMLRKGGTF